MRDLVTLYGPLSAVTTASELHYRVRPMTGDEMDVRLWPEQAEVARGDRCSGAHPFDRWLA